MEQTFGIAQYVPEQDGGVDNDGGVAAVAKSGWDGMIPIGTDFRDCAMVLNLNRLRDCNISDSYATSAS